MYRIQYWQLVNSDCGARMRRCHKLLNKSHKLSAHCVDDLGKLTGQLVLTVKGSAEDMAGASQ